MSPVCRSLVAVLALALALSGITGVVASAAAGPPDTTITSGPPAVSNSPSATFVFTSNDARASFECSRDGQPYFACRSPRTETGFGHNAHNFFVRARSAAGVDATPARWGWRVVPNILVINTDDQRGDGTMQVMPKTRRWFAEGGTTFANGYASTPVCCPSRSGLFSGRYTHNHGNLNNQTTKNLDYQATVMAYLKRAGYQTAMAGKFLLEWRNSDPPPFFDHWALTSGGYVNVPYGTDQGPVTADYTTSEMRRQARRMLNAFETNDNRPFFLYLAPQAPHAASTPGTFVPEPKYAAADVGPCNPSPGVRESDKSDKPAWVRNYNTSLQTGCHDRQGQLRTLLSVDDMVDAVMTRLGELGETNTVAVFTSDNGYLWGEHGVREKFLPYTESVKVPFLVRWPGRVPAGRVDRRPVANVDITPSVLAAAGLTPALKYPFDGRSFLTTTGLSSTARAEAYFEQFKDADRPTFPAWRSIRTAAAQYIEWYDAAGAVIFREYYNLTADPFQLTNLLADGNPNNNPDTTALAARLARYKTCRGTSGGSACP